MSTDIVGFQQLENHESKRVFQLKALQLYLAISVPLIVITLLLSYFFYQWETREERISGNADCEKNEPSVSQRRGSRLLQLLASKRLPVFAGKTQIFDRALSNLR